MKTNNRNRREQKNPKNVFENNNQIKEGFKTQVKMLLYEKGQRRNNSCLKNILKHY